MDETSRLATPGELVSVSIYHDQGLSRRLDGRRNAVIAAQAPSFVQYSLPGQLATLLHTNSATCHLA